MIQRGVRQEDPASWRALKYINKPTEKWDKNLKSSLLKVFKVTRREQMTIPDLNGTLEYRG